MEAKLKNKIAEIESKTQLLTAEIQQRQQAQESSAELEKIKAGLQVELDEAKRKLEKAQEAKQADAARIEDLEVRPSPIFLIFFSPGGFF